MFDSKDWRNMLDAVCRWKPEEWNSHIVGEIFYDVLTMSHCERSG